MSFLKFRLGQTSVCINGANYESNMGKGFLQDYKTNGNIKHEMGISVGLIRGFSVNIFKVIKI